MAIPIAWVNVWGYMFDMVTRPTTSGEGLGWIDLGWIDVGGIGLKVDRWGSEERRASHRS